MKILENSTKILLAMMSCNKQGFFSQLYIFNFYFIIIHDAKKTPFLAVKSPLRYIPSIQVVIWFHQWKSPSLVTMSPTTFQLQNIVERNKCSCKVFFAIRKYILKLQTKKIKNYKSKLTFQLKVLVTCQYHNNSHYLPFQLQTTYHIV